MSYGSLFYLMTREERQSNLQEHCNLFCQRQAYDENWIAENRDHLKPKININEKSLPKFYSHLKFLYERSKDMRNLTK